METLEFYKNADLETLVPVSIKLNDNTVNTVMIPKGELWYDKSIYSGHKESGFKFDKLLKALDNRKLNYKTASYPFI